MNLLYLVVIGFFSGWLAGKFMGGGYGALADTVLGVLGGVFGAWAFAAIGVWPGGGIVPALFVGFAGSVSLVWLVRRLKRTLS